MTQTLDALLSDFNQYKQQFQTQAQEKFKDYFVEFWDKNPSIKAVIWTQYAPYFNDGEPCVFSVYDAYFTNAEGEDLNEVSWGGEYEGEKEGIWCDYSFGVSWRPPTPGGVNEESTKQLSKLICSNEMESVMEMMFGSDSKVIATREGFQVEDISGEHD
jgi:hypothetical protein